MVMNRKPLVALAAAAVAVTLAGCGGGTTSGNKGNGSSEGKTGGTLNYLTFRPTEHLDPQRTYIGRDITNMDRLAYRGLVTYPITTDTKKGTTPVPDLATDTGTTSKDAKTWSFTLKDGVKWQDGKDITCEDLKYGAVPHVRDRRHHRRPELHPLLPRRAARARTGCRSTTARTRTRTRLTSTRPSPATARRSPTSSTSPSRTSRSRSPRCSPSTRTARTRTRATSPTTRCSPSGPYKLEGKWNTTKGGTFVRNDQWDPKTDDVRKALPDKIVFTQGLTNEVITDRLIADSGHGPAGRHRPCDPAGQRTRRSPVRSPTVRRRSTRRTSTTCCRTSTR